MKLKQRSKKVVAWGLTAAMSLSLLFTSGKPAVIKAEESDAEESAVTLSNPVIEAEKGHVVWDCIYFGNYWQKKYITQPGNMPKEGEDDVVHTDDDGTKYIVRADKSCYKYEPIKWRVLSVSEDGTDAFLMADQTLDGKVFYSDSDTKNTATWENSDVRVWLNETFMETAFSLEEQEAIKTTEIENLSYSSYYGGDLEDATPTEDRIYLPSLDDMVNMKYGFVNNFNPSDNPIDMGFSDTQTRQADNTDFAKWGEDGYKTGGYLLRTLGAFEGYVFCTDGGEIPTAQMFSTAVDDPGHGIRPVLHLDLTKTELWQYAGKVRQDKTETAPDATPVVPTERPIAQPGVTMAPGQTYPKNPVVNETDLNKNTWDCIYFGNYYNTKITPSVLALAEEDNTVKADEEGEEYLIRHEQGYFQYEPIKWRVLSINEDGTDAFLMADQVLDVTKYYSEGSVEITWEKSDARAWLNDTFMKTAFTETEIGAIKETTVTTANNKWSGEAGGNDTKDKIYLASIEEMLETSYGFSSDEKEQDTRKITATDFAKAEENLAWIESDSGLYWLRSQGREAGYPARVDHWGDIDINEMQDSATRYLGVRPVMHVDLSDTALWTYAGQVTPKGVVVPKEPTQTEEPTQDPQTTQPIQNPQTTQPEQNLQTIVPVQNPQTEKPEIKKPAKPKIKSLKNKKGKKVTVTLSKAVSGVSGYQVAYAAKASMKGQKTKSFKGTSVTVKGLKKKKTYYFRVRAYTKENGKTVYGNWSSKKSIKVKK